jgi:hypothetical protein
MGMGFSQEEALDFRVSLLQLIFCDFYFSMS